MHYISELAHGCSVAIIRARYFCISPWMIGNNNNPLLLLLLSLERSVIAICKGLSTWTRHSANGHCSICSSRLRSSDKEINSLFDHIDDIHHRYSSKRCSMYIWLFQHVLLACSKRWKGIFIAFCCFSKALMAMFKMSLKAGACC